MNILPLTPAIAVNPQGHLYWDAAGGEEAWPDAPAAQRAEKAFALGGTAGKASKPPQIGLQKPPLICITRLKATL